MLHQGSDREKRSLLDEVIASNLEELERLAQFYYQRGNYERAEELKHTIELMRAQVSLQYRKSS